MNTHPVPCKKKSYYLMSTEIDLTIEAYDVIDNDRIEGFNVTVTPQVPGGNGPTFSGLTNSAGKATFQNVHVSYNFYFKI